MPSNLPKRAPNYLKDFCPSLWNRSNQKSTTKIPSEINWPLSKDWMQSMKYKMKHLKWFLLITTTLKFIKWGTYIIIIVLLLLFKSNTYAFVDFLELETLENFLQWMPSNLSSEILLQFVQVVSKYPKGCAHNSGNIWKLKLMRMQKLMVFTSIQVEINWTSCLENAK